MKTKEEFDPFTRNLTEEVRQLRKDVNALIECADMLLTAVRDITERTDNGFYFETTHRLQGKLLEVKCPK